MNIIIVVNNPRDWLFEIKGVNVVTADDYLTDSRYVELSHTRVFNLCRDYSYQSLGYYVSLLAAARGHKPIPSVSTIQDMKSPSMVRLASEDLEEHIQESLAAIRSRRFTLNIYFGRTMARRHERLCLELFNLFQAPFLRARFAWDEEDGWRLQGIRPVAASEIPVAHRPFVVAMGERFFSRGSFQTRKRRPPRYNMAILYNPDEADTPSDAAAIERFVRSAAHLGIEAEVIGRDDFGRIAEFDALFLRETTRVTHHTFRFARRAEAEGLVVIDDSLSILRCTNKVYLHELLQRHEIRTPKTMIVHEDNLDRVITELGLPVVLKQPDSSFSQGVVKADDEASLRAEAQRLFEKSDLILAQEFLATPFDWRIGILDRRPLYACKYYMARRHWQIIDRSNGHPTEGRSETLPVELAPHAVVATALRAANLIGDGLYGVDLKQLGRRCYVIEVNDNPSIESGVEDDVLRGELYRRIMEVFLRRMEARHVMWGRE